MRDSRGPEGPRVVARVITLLSAFDAEHPALSLTELARRSGLPLTTTHRLLAELERGEFVARTPDGVYCIGRRLWQIGTLAPLNRVLRAAAMPALRALAQETGFDVALAVGSGNRVLYVDRAVTRPKAVANPPGMSLPLPATAAGKVILAHSQTCLVHACISSLAPLTPWTVTDPRRLSQQLAMTKDLGYASNSQECHLGVAAIAVPVSGKTGDPVAALVLVSPTPAVPPKSVLAPMRIAAVAITRALPADETL
jgi:DNA-binding IclR family transcriptional regulator